MTTAKDHRRLLQQATRSAHGTLCHYFYSLYQEAGLPWSADNEAELLGLVESMAEAGYQQAMLHLTEQKRRNDRSNALGEVDSLVASLLAQGLVEPGELRNVINEAVQRGEAAYELFVIAPRHAGARESMIGEVLKTWRLKVQQLPRPLPTDDPHDESTARGALIGEIARGFFDYKLGPQLCEVIAALMALEEEGDKTAVHVLDCVILDQRKAATDARTDAGAKG